MSLLRGCLLVPVLAGGLVAGCGGGDDAPAPAPDAPLSTARTFLIKPTATATEDMAVAMTLVAPGDTIQFDCGFFDISTTLQLINTENIVVKGCGKDRTVLSFKNNNLPEGILAVNVAGLVVEDLTVLDTGGNGIEFRGVDHGTIRRVRALWSSGGGRESTTPITAENYDDNGARLLNVPCTDPPTDDPRADENEGGDTTSPDYTPSEKSGRYGIYPVTSRNILIEDSESVGASDAGIYVGQTNNAILRRNRAAYNVFGMEIENVNGGEYDSNLAECNTGGFLVYDADGLSQYGDRSRMFNNISRDNNTYNFTAGGFVANVPAGSGMITLSYDRIDVYDNLFENNNTGGIIHASYELFPEGAGRPTENRIDWYTEGMHIFRNTFRNNGNRLPVATTSDMASQQVARALPALVGFKTQAGCGSVLPVPSDPDGRSQMQMCQDAAANNPEASDDTNSGFRGAHIVWDGLLDLVPNTYDHDGNPATAEVDCPYPKDAEGKDVPKDARGKPLHSNAHPDPACHYNAYKFVMSDPQKPRIAPDWWASCIDADNDFSNDSLTFTNFRGLKGVTDGRVDQFPASFDMSAHQCVEKYGRNLPLLQPVVIPPFVASGDYDPAPTAERVAELCGAAVAAGQVNHAAAAVNCPTLDQYNLFADAQDPRSTPNGGGVPFSMNSKLFSDYAVKYRVLYLPPGKTATYNAPAGVSTANANLTFPTGTIIAKTFAFRSGTSENVVETRLLIRRESSSGRVRWDGVPYIWTTENGKRVAKLALTGGTASVSWNMIDVDSGTTHAGSTNSYRIPNVNQCISCHGGSDKEPGAAPIGMKVRNLNGAFRAESVATTGHGNHAIAGKNQIKYLCDNGKLAGCPADLAVEPGTQVANVERVPIYNKPGDSGQAANSAADVESRARAWLEVNCAHCHNPQGFAASTGLFLDVRRAVDHSYGICKQPVAAGAEGTGGRTVDIHPGDASKSVMEYRIGPEATKPSARMPPIARSVVDVAGHELVAQWIDEVVDATYEGGECAVLSPP